MAVLCDSSYNTSVFTTSSNRLYIHMETDSSVRKGGFRAQYTITAVQQTGLCVRTIAIAEANCTNTIF